MFGVLDPSGDRLIVLALVLARVLAQVFAVVLAESLFTSTVPFLLNSGGSSVWDRTDFGGRCAVCPSRLGRCFDNSLRIRSCSITNQHQSQFHIFSKSSLSQVFSSFKPRRALCMENNTHPQISPFFTTALPCIWNGLCQSKNTSSRASYIPSFLCS